MIEVLFIIAYAGGTIPAYRHARTNGYGTIGATWQSATWPADVGWEIADRYCRSDKE